MARSNGSTLLKITCNTAAVNRIRPSRETPLGLGAKKDGCFRRLEIFKFEKFIKYANEMSDDVIHLTQYYLKYSNRAINNLQCRPLKLGRLIVL